MNPGKLRYAIAALPRRFVQPRTCPSCTADTYKRVERKGFHELLRCSRCSLLYRWPYETAAEMANFYQAGYSQPGLTTDLPGADALQGLIQTGFKGSQKDFSRSIELFDALGVKKGSRILDFGANWGYGVWQFRQAGYDALGFEVSRPRAEFSQKLGVRVLTQWEAVAAAAPFDVAFSSHVLEHTPDPAKAIQDKLSVLRPGGWLVALFPNGCDAFRQSQPKAFHLLWGRVHPVMLNDRFSEWVLGPRVVFQGHLAAKDIERLRHGATSRGGRGDLSQSEMLLIARNQ